MKLNRVNKILLGIAMLMVVAIAIKLIRYSSWNRYYYAVGACAPETFPVYVRELYFITGNGEWVHADTEDVNYFKGEWGVGHFFPEANSSELVPEKLVINYASFREGSFYSDTILLPKEKITALFKTTLEGRDTEDIYYRGNTRPGLAFMIGIANKGNIIVWAMDKKNKTEITRKKIPEKIPGEADTYSGGQMTREAYLEEKFSLLNDSIKMLIRSGFDSGANYIDSTIVN